MDNDEHICHHCGYDLRGTDSETCPECGTYIIHGESTRRRLAHRRFCFDCLWAWGIRIVSFTPWVVAALLLHSNGSITKGAWAWMLLGWCTVMIAFSVSPSRDE